MDADIDLLVNNFKQFWKSGRSAHLDIDCHAGQAWMGLRVRLGHVHDHDHQPEIRTRNGPSRQRRRMHRAAARQQAAEEAAAVTSDAEEATSKSILTKEVEVTGEVIEKKIEDIDDEIELTEISVKAEETAEEECVVDETIKIEGEFKNPNLKPWTKFDPEEEVKLMWDIIKKESENKGIEEMGDASATFEHCFEFWGTWKIRKPGMKLKYLQNSENWTKGFKITEVRPP